MPFGVPFSVDVPVYFSRPTSYAGADFSVHCFISSEMPLSAAPATPYPTGKYLREYGALRSVINDFGAGSNTAYYASVFFNNRVHPNTFYVAAPKNVNATLPTTAAAMTTMLQAIYQESLDLNQPFYGITTDLPFRTDVLNEAVSSWVETTTQAEGAYQKLFVGVTNDATQITAAPSATGAATIAKNLQRIRTSYIYVDSTNPQNWPDAAYIAWLLGTLPQQTLTMKFKGGVGIVPVRTDETILYNLMQNRVNVYTQLGKNVYMFREGQASADTWFSDSIVNIDWCVNELQLSVIKAFMSDYKVPLTTEGVARVRGAISEVMQRFVANGAFAEREVLKNNGVDTDMLDAFTITNDPLSSLTATMRANRQGPNFYITAYEASAMHKVEIRMEVYN